MEGYNKQTQNKLCSGIPAILLRKPASAPALMRVSELGFIRPKKKRVGIGFGCERQDQDGKGDIAALCSANKTQGYVKREGPSPCEHEALKPDTSVFTWQILNKISAV